MSFIIIPDIIKKNKQISSTSKLIYGDILSLSSKHGYCYANNEYFAKIYDISTRAVSKIIGQLSEFNIIEIRNSTCEFSKAREIVPLIFTDTEQKFEEVGTKVPRTKVLEDRNKSSDDIEQKFQQAGTKVQNDRNKSSNIIDNIKDNLINKENISIKDKGETTEKKSELIFPFTFSDALIEKFKNFIKYRKEIKKPFKSNQSIIQLIEKIEKIKSNCSDFEIIEIINLSIENGWQGLFFENIEEIRSKKKQQPPKQETQEPEFKIFTSTGRDLTQDPNYIPEIGW